MDYSFKILGIKVLPDCASGMRKVLNEGETYLFNTDYAIDATNEYTLKQICAPNPIAEKLYLANGKDKQPVHINIQAYGIHLER